MPGTKTRPARPTPKPKSPARPAGRQRPLVAVRSEVVTITPALAEEWLGKNSHNRTLRNRTVSDLAGAIQRGEWFLNGEAVKFSITDTLLDGQHRLWAVIESDTPVQSLVIWGLPDEAQETMDTGARRSLKDTLTLRQIADSSALAAVITYWWRYQNGHVRYAGAKPTIAQAIACFDANPSLRDALTVGKRANKKFRVSPAMAAACWFEFSTIDQDDADTFFETLVSGIGLTEHDPIFVLRRYLERQAMSSVGARASSVINHALFIKAWNAYRDGREVDGLNWKAAGVNAEGFPEAH